MGRIGNIGRNGRVDAKKVKLCILLAGCAFLLLAVLKTEYKERNLSQWNDAYLGADEAIQMLTFSGYEKSEWEELLDMKQDRELKFVDVKKILEHLGATEYVTYQKEGDAKAIDRKTWYDIYDQLLELLDTNQKVSCTPCLILKKDSKEQQVQTQDGSYSYLVPDDFLEETKGYLCYLYENTIIGLKREKGLEVVLPNVYFEGVSQQKASVLFGGQTYEFPLEEAGEDLSGTVCDMHFKDGEIFKIDRKQETITGNLLTVDEQKIEIDGYGPLKRAKVLPVYKTYGTIEQKDVSDIVIGNMNVTYVVAGDEVCAILLNQPANLSNIRVLLLDGDGTVYRDGVWITCDGEYQVVYGENTAVYGGGTLFDTASYLTEAGDGYVRIDAVNGNEMYLADASGSRISYGYEGGFEVRRYAEGFVVINDVPIENYLYQVVTSEMPANYQPEALKAQAVCARSYAYRQLLQSEYAQYGAHVDDSTNYQVYNRQEHTDIARTAVDDTCGEVMTCGGEIIEAFYFSTSCGMTQDDCVWNNVIADDYPFLKVTRVSADQTPLALSDEAAFYQYITGIDDSCFDVSSHFFRWSTTAKLTDERMEQARQVLAVRKEIKPENILLYDSSGNPTDTVSGLGKLLSMQIKARGNGGAVLDLVLTYENGTAEVLSEYNIRKVLGCLVDDVHLLDGTTQKMAILPSACFTFSYDETTGTYTIYGGGYGHGVGMSQNGAEGMAELGYSYKDILNFFFKDIEIEPKG